MSGYTVKPPTGDTNEQTQFIDYFNLFYSKRGQELDWPPESPDNQYHLNKW